MTSNEYKVKSIMGGIDPTRIRSYADKILGLDHLIEFIVDKLTPGHVMEYDGRYYLSADVSLYINDAYETLYRTGGSEFVKLITLADGQVAARCLRRGDLEFGPYDTKSGNPDCIGFEVTEDQVILNPDAPQEDWEYDDIVHTEIEF